MSSNRIISIVGLVTLPVAAFASGGVEAMLWTGGFSCLFYSFVSAMFEDL